ncbi:flavodoxin domain-containing protein [Streptomyces tagetis]|uniref:Flavodoxin n=1 Tax=Streptomyces tagetis TaxID=2820809 RepID=A0A940XG18_9ACTN|nr:flavodoxin domain-containing protein [Streptomyces sp. RG38]MBQ0825951.1 flavodoxin [Streptomyces sp. RG38]
MPDRVLVAYGTTNGSTARIAETVADVLRDRGVDAVAEPAGSVADVTPYRAVVIGGALYGGRWHRDARRLVRRHRRELAARPVWLFSSGPLDFSAGRREIPPVPGVRRAAARLDAVEHVTFGGCLEDGARGRMARMILKDGRGGDFRDFGAIERWAAHIADRLTVARSG